MADFYLSDQQVARRYGVHRSTIWRWVKTAPDFPEPVVLSLGCMDLPDFGGERLAHFPDFSLEGDGALEAER